MNKKYRKYKLKTLFAFLFLTGCLFLQAVPVRAQQMNRLIQTTTDEEMWNGYVDLGMTKTHISEDDTLEEVQEKVKQSCVSISLYDSNGNTDKSFHAAGFIIEITNERIYVATNRHVCYMQWGPKNGFCICFENEELNNILEENHLKGTMLGYTGDYDYGDFAIIEIDISQLPYEEKILFKEVPINKGTIDTSVGTTAYFYHITSSREYKIKSVEIMETRQELCLKWALERLHLQCNIVSANGDSGSYYFDENGNLIGILVGMTGKVIDGNRIRRDHLLNPDAIFDAYEKIVGVPLE